MTTDREGFYARLESDYAATIRQLVPAYDDMSRCILDLLRLHAPRTVLEVGVGTGEVTAILLEQLPDSRLTGLEPGPTMREHARRAVQTFGPRVTIVGDRAEDFEPTERFDAVMSNLVLHNVSHDAKPDVLDVIRRCLVPDGIFVWGDFIRYADPQLHGHFLECRKEFARDHGCPDDIVAANFEKETGHDYPLTLDETVSLARTAGFAAVEPVWMRDCFLVVMCRG